MAKDILGQEFGVGDFIVHTHGKTTRMFIGRVTEIKGIRVYFEDVLGDKTYRSYKEASRCLKYPKTEAAILHANKVLFG